MMIAAAILATIAAVLIGREVLRQQEFPAAWELSVATPANAIVEWCQANLGDVTSAISDFVLIYLLDPLQDLLHGRAVVDGRGGVRADRLARLGVAAGGGDVRLRRGDRHARDVGPRDGHAEPRPRRGRHLGGLRDPARGSWPRGATGSRSSRDPSWTRCRRCRRSCTWCRCCSCSSPAACPAIIASVIYALPVGIRLTDLGIRQVPKEIVEAARALRLDPLAAPAEGPAAARPAVDPAGRQPDDHDGAVGRDHRRTDRRGRPGAGGRLRARQATDRPRRRGRYQHPAPRRGPRPYHAGDGFGAAHDARTGRDRSGVVDARPRDRRNRTRCSRRRRTDEETLVDLGGGARGVRARDDGL